jgi:hypothetical protein
MAVNQPYRTGNTKKDNGLFLTVLPLCAERTFES